MIKINSHKFVIKETTYGSSFVTILLSRIKTEIKMQITW